MARYIDADELLENLKNQYGEELGWQCTVNMSDVGMMIEDSPTADVVPVVRCKDCEHGQFMPSCSMYLCRCTGGKLRYADDYCNYGERRANDGNS